MRLLAGRVHEREQQQLGMAYNSLRRRVATALLRLHEQAPEAAIQLLRDDLAAVVGSAPESLIRTLSEFKHNDLIEQNNQIINILQTDKLHRHIGKRQPGHQQAVRVGFRNWQWRMWADRPLEAAPEIYHALSQYQSGRTDR
ncbi:Crp/Fnr family transcriptional regulator [Hymenobacter convexus]|uniref:Crp/Fnr family transcriptional regulator n=1 Tax=Hymenobacter sp. CA1UV-4 TaxID=3063782 RepID=UPI00271262DC|nr:helix-turn-helix domain-containing protein [Hymenobacter sp. CA1UV-4]MDO7852458.1 helix-turn-helix domain-containing protein [Hymenobacter sp. CA1UV-4]